MLSLFVVYLYAVQEAPSAAGLAVTSVCSFICCWHLGIIDCITYYFCQNKYPAASWVGSGVSSPRE